MASYDLVITNGTVVDGTGLPRRVADVGIRDGRIAAIGFIDASEEWQTEFVTRNSQLSDLLARARMVANTDTSVLLTGESGTGKEPLARAIHMFSPRRDGPFIATDCGLLAADSGQERLNAALRAAEMGCDALLKGTQVDGVYTADPKKDKTATRYDKLSYHEVLARDLKVMDASAVSLMRDNGIPIVVFSINTRGSLADVLHGRGVCTTITD